MVSLDRPSSRRTVEVAIMIRRSPYSLIITRARVLVELNNMATGRYTPVQPLRYSGDFSCQLGSSKRRRDSQPRVISKAAKVLAADGMLLNTTGEKD